ncbi:polyphosphate:AMP phosphotransferase [Methylobacter marinus]|uniref:polyphosphate:AMP phosphotransferase n=1 Tax=Methylobacter marinus TaxID=34058 RepID=UPI000363ADDA|nr:polyphosphate:AMP phosphotransferase [Methylobacter marinus]
MFEISGPEHRLKKAEYDKQVLELRTHLLTAQRKLRSADFSVIILVSGVDGGGKGEIINLLNEWMDSRYIQTNAFDEPSDEEKERPKFWRFWRTLPAKGTIGIYIGSWYSEPISQRVRQEITNDQLHVELTHIKQFEQLLTDDGVLIIKCWLHLNKDEQQKRLKKLEKNPQTSWRVSDRDKKHLKTYDDFIRVAERTLFETSTAAACWRIIDGTDRRYSCLSVGRHVLDSIGRHIERRTAGQGVVEPVNTPGIIDIPRDSVLARLDLSLKLSKKTYDEQLSFYQGELSRLTRLAHQKKCSSILVFEGWDASGKGGGIRRLIHALDARHYRVISVAAPTDEERSRHYLWRFWRHIPRAGKITIYDRSWYGRVLVERVEGFAAEHEWRRGFSEIVNFEEELMRAGIIILKFWLHIDQDEQLRRFRERERIIYKQHKITEEDYRNREKWADYELAVNDMITRTSTEAAPWILVEGNDKKYARIKVLKSYCEKLESIFD